jgi:hypothetical protein
MTRGMLSCNKNEREGGSISWNGTSWTSGFYNSKERLRSIRSISVSGTSERFWTLWCYELWILRRWELPAMGCSGAKQPQGVFVTGCSAHLERSDMFRGPMWWSNCLLQNISRHLNTFPLNTMWVGIKEHLSSNCEQSMMIFEYFRYFLFGRSAGPECAGRAVCEKHYWGHEHESASAAEMGIQKVDGYDDCHDGYELWLVMTSYD